MTDTPEEIYCVLRSAGGGPWLAINVTANQRQAENWVHKRRSWDGRADFRVEAYRSVATPAGEDVGRIVAWLRDMNARGVVFHGQKDMLRLAEEIEDGAWRSTPLPASTGYEPKASDPIPRIAGEAEPR